MAKAKYQLTALASAPGDPADEWLWPGYIPAGSIGVLDGDPGLGKSMVTIDLAARITMGKPWPDGKPNDHGKGTVLILAAEDSGATMRKRITAAGGDARKVFHLSANQHGRPPSIPDDLPILEEIITEHKVSLLIVDPVMAFLSVTAYRDQSLRSALSPLARVCERTGCVVLFVRHLTKGGGRNAKQGGGGSMGLIGACRFGYLFSPSPDDPDKRVIAATKMNLAKEPPSLTYHMEESKLGAFAVWEGEVKWSAEDLSRSRHVDTDERNEREEVVQWLTDHLDENGGINLPLDIEREAHVAGFSKSQLRTAKKKLGVRSKKVGATSWYWVTESYVKNHPGLAVVRARSGNSP